MFTFYSKSAGVEVLPKEYERKFIKGGYVRLRFFEYDDIERENNIFVKLYPNEVFRLYYYIMDCVNNNSNELKDIIYHKVDTDEGTRITTISVERWKSGDGFSLIAKVRLNNDVNRINVGFNKIDFIFLAEYFKKLSLEVAYEEYKEKEEEF